MSLLHQKEGELQAQPIKDAINSGYDIDLDHVKIKGNLILSVAEAVKRDFRTATTDISSEKPKHITSQMRFHHCIFEGIVDFANTIFCQEVSFSGSHFMDDAIFCPVSGGIPLKSAEFQKYTNFSHTHFHKYTDFNSVNFKDEVVFQEAEFRDGGGNHVDFSHVKFRENANFVRSQFNVEARFMSARFYGSTNFSSGTAFYKKANFGDTIFYGIVFFYACKFKDDADFSYANFDRDVLLTHSIFDKDLLLKEARIKIMKMDEVQFEKESVISLKGSYFDRLIVDWITIKTHLDKEDNDDASYLALIKNFSDLGRFDDADDCKLQYKTVYKK